jgi:hypothetical protein
MRPSLPVDGAVAGHHAVAERTVLGEAEVAAAVPGQRVEFDERIVVQQGIDALAGGRSPLACTFCFASDVAMEATTDTVQPFAATATPRTS